MLSVEDVMTRNVVYSSSETMLSKAIALMEESDVKELPVVDKKNRLVGMVTFYDLGRMVKASSNSKVKNVMFTPPTLDKFSTINDAVKVISESGIEAIPVIENNKLIGILSDYDILRHYKEIGALKNLRVDDMMKREFEMLFENDSVAKAKRIMERYRLDSLPVLDKDRKYVGFLLSLDLLKRFFISPKIMGSRDARGDFQKAAEFPVSGVMRRSKETLSPMTSIEDTIKIMLSNKLKALPVINEKNEIVGIMLRRDIITHLRNQQPEKMLQIKFLGKKLDWEAQNDIVDTIKFHIKKLTTFCTDINGITVYIKEMGEKKRYEVTLHVECPVKPRVVKRSGFNLRAIITECLEIVERMLRGY